MSVLTAGRTQLLAGGSHAPVSSRHGSPALERMEEERGERADGGEDAVVGRRVACPGIVQARLTCP